jgi:hypothetical protein
LFVRILCPFVSPFGPYTLLKIFLSHTLRASSICSDIVHPSQPYMILPDYMAKYTWKHSPSFLPPWEPELSWIWFLPQNKMCLHYKDHLIPAIREIITAYFDNHRKPINTLCG